MARCISTSPSLISFVDLFSSYCYIISHDYSSSTIRSFHTSNCELNSLRVPKHRITCIEHIDVTPTQSFSYVAGTDAAVLLWINRGTILASFSVLEQQRPAIVSLKSYYYERILVVACGMDNGQVMLASQNNSIDSVPLADHHCGKVTGIEMLQYDCKDFFVIFRENPGSVSVFRHSDADSDYYEEYFTDLEENISLVEMTSYEQCSVFFLTLNSTVLSVSFYCGSNRLETLYSRDFNRTELRNVVTFALPESSLFYNSREFGCDLCMVSRGGSELQIMTLTSCKEEALMQEVAEACVEKVIWQKPEMQSRVIREIGSQGEVESEYSDEDIRILDVFAAQRKCALVADFIQRKIGNTFVMPMDYANLIASWVKKEYDKRQEKIEAEVIPSYLQSYEDSKALVPVIENLLDDVYEYQKVATSLKERLVSTGLCQDTESLIFIMKVLVWIAEKGLLEIFNEMNWDNQRQRLSALNAKYSSSYSTYETQGLFLDDWVEGLIPQLKAQFYESINKTVVLTLLVNTQSSLFSRIFLHLLLDLEADSLELKNLHACYLHDFMISSSEASYIRGCWSLDMLSHPSFIPTDESESQPGHFQQYSKDAL